MVQGGELAVEAVDFVFDCCDGFVAEAEAFCRVVAGVVGCEVGSDVEEFVLDVVYGVGVGGLQGGVCGYGSEV